MDLQKFNNDGTPVLDEDGNFVYELYIEPDWSKFRLYFSINSDWVVYTTKIPPFFSASLTSLILQQNPDVMVINSIVSKMLELVTPPNNVIETWQSIANICNTGIQFIK